MFKVLWICVGNTLTHWKKKFLWTVM